MNLLQQCNLSLKMKKQYSLAELVAADQFKSYEDLKKRLGYVLGNAAPRQDAEVEDEVEIIQRERAEQVVTAATESTSAPVTAAEEDDTLSYFARLAEE